jgi:glycosyltransferase involved in cell wall biosynthesis
VKILYHHRIASKDGQYVHIEELTKALKARGHELVMVGPKVAEQGDFGADGGLVAMLKRHIPKVLYELMELGYSLRAYWKLRQAVKRHRPDCLYERYNLYLPAGVWLKRRFGLPMLLEVNAPLLEERSRYDGMGLPRLAAWSQRYAWQGADGVLPVTRVLADIVAAQGVAQERIHVIPNGIDWARFRDLPERADAKRAHGLEGRLVLGFTGFVREWHGLERVVDLVAQADERHLLIVGDGPARACIEQRARELGVSDRITITGVVGRDRVAGYLAAYDIALQPDVVAYASPLKLFEYLAMGCAIIAPDSPNIREVLSHGDNGWLFDVDEPAALPAAIEQLCHDETLRERLSAAARDTIDARGLTWAKNAERVEDLFQTLGVNDNRV